MTSPFVAGPPVRIAGAPRGPLAGLTFAAKDLFDVADYPTGGGNPDWARRHPIPTRHAWAVQCLLDAGATLVGKTITDEVSLGILGENPFDGTPLNPAAPEHVPGGSSSGSASAVAQGLCDFALGTDSGGSVRVPASFCGLYGIRPTHGRLDVTGMMPQSPSSDTAGWFARDAETFARASAVLLDEPIVPASLPTAVVVAVDAFGLADAETAAALQPMVRSLAMLVGTRAGGSPGAAGAVGLGAGAADTPVQRGLADVQGLARSRQSAPGLQRGARPRRREHGLRRRAPVGRADARRGARPPGLAGAARDHRVHADDAVSGAPEGAVAGDARAAPRRASPAWPRTAG